MTSFLRQPHDVYAPNRCQFARLGVFRRCTLRSGFSLIEMMVALAILALIIGLAGPSFVDMVKNLRVRSAAESMSGALLLSRTEAVRSNGTVMFQLMSSLENSCVLDSSGKNWVVSLCPAEGKCGGSVDRSYQRPVAGCGADALILAKGVIDGSNAVEIVIPNAMVCLSSLGRINPFGSNCPAGSLDPSDLGGTVTIDITDPNANCASDGGTVRCLRINIGPSGEARMCDPAVSASDDPRKC